MRTRVLKLWNRIREPRVVSTLRFCMYLVMLLGAVTALISPPRSIEGAVGELAMTGLATLLAFGGVLGAIAALPGIWWLERTAILAITLALGIYGLVVVSMHLGGEGNRLLQLSIVVGLMLSQAIRWVRIRERPYDPELRAPTSPSLAA